MINLKEYVGKTVTIECFDGRIYKNHYVAHFLDVYDTFEPFEDSIAIQKNKNYNGGTTLYKSEIKSITVIE